MPHGLTGKHTIGRSRRFQAKLVTPQYLKENAEDLCRVKDQGIFTYLGQ